MTEVEKKTTKKRSPHIKGDVLFESYIIKLLKAVHKDGIGISGSALKQLNSTVNFLLRALNDECEKVRLAAGVQTLSSRLVQTAVKVMIPGELAKHAVTEGTKAIRIFNASEPGQSEKRSLASRAKLIISPARVGKFLTAPRKSQGAKIYLAAVIDYLLLEILDISGDKARQAKRVRITSRHLMLTVKTDEELKSLFDKYKIEFAGAGVMPSIHTELLPQEGEPKKSKALKQIRTYQKATQCVMIPAASFKRLVREVTQDVDPDMKFSKDAFNAIQTATESHIVKILENANISTIHAGRVRLTPKDIKVARQISSC